VKAAVVGTGHGARVQVPALRAAGFDVVALVGQDLDRTQRRADRLGIERASVSLTDVLGVGDIDLVGIATPPESHRRLTLESFEAGCHVLCEKPLALSRAEALEMYEASMEAGKVGVVGNEFRFRDSRAAVTSALEAGRIGAPVFIDLMDQHSLLVEQAQWLPAWFRESAFGGGWLGSSGSHAIDQALAWAGEVSTVSAFLHQTPYRQSGDSDDAFNVVLKFKSGAEAIIQESGASFGPRFRLERLIGEQGVATIVDETPLLIDSSGSHQLEPPPMPFPGTEGDLDDPRDEFQHLRPFARLAFKMRELIEGRPNDQPGVPRLPTFEDGLRTITVMDAVRQSARAGGEQISIA
jgi:predicted dehydrogenase